MRMGRDALGYGCGDAGDPPGAYCGEAGGSLREQGTHLGFGLDRDSCLGSGGGHKA